MNTMTPAQVAARLRILADLLDVAADPAPIRLHLILSLPSYYATGLDEPGRVDAVSTVAAALGMTAQPEQALGGGWQHRAAEEGDGYTVTVYTSITGPQMCSCGAACTHGGALAAAA